MSVSEFVTKDGHRIPLRRVAPILIEKVRQSVKIPTPPTYEVEVAGGDIETHIHDETTLETDEDRAAWAEYKRAETRANGEIMEKVLRLLFVRATGDVLPDDDGWIADQEYLGIQVPAELKERKVHYIQTELLTHAEDILRFMTAAMTTMGIEEETVAAAENTFRATLRESSGADADPDTGGATPAGEVVAHATVRGNGNGQSVGADAQPVGRPRRRR